MNFIYDVLSQKPNYKISVITSVNSSPFTNQEYDGVKIYRLGSVSVISLKRYLSYLIFNFWSLIILLLKRPDVVVAYETLSVFPAFVYSQLFKKKKIHVHYHEFLSIPERKQSSEYMKLLFKFEAKLLKKTSCSQTNKDRKVLFLRDNHFLKKENVYVYPNVPPDSWWQDFGSSKKPWEGGKIKLVYVGALDAETMFLEEILKWVLENSEDLELTIYSQNISEGAMKLIQKYRSNSIHLNQALNYYQLPSALVQYDLGLVLYKGHIPNYVFNIPNKVYEYLSCGLKVLSDSVITSLKDSDLSGVISLDLQDLNEKSILVLKTILSIPIERTNQNKNNLVQIL